MSTNPAPPALEIPEGFTGDEYQVVINLVFELMRYRQENINSLDACCHMQVHIDKLHKMAQSLGTIDPGNIRAASMNFIADAMLIGTLLAKLMHMQREIHPEVWKQHVDAVRDKNDKAPRL